LVQQQHRAKTAGKTTAVRRSPTRVSQRAVQMEGQMMKRKSYADHRHRGRAKA